MISAAAFVVFALVCSVWAFTRHPIWALYFYLGTTYVFPPGRWWGYVFGDFRWALVSAAITVLAVAFHRGKLNNKPPWIANAPALAIVLYAVVMVLQSPWALSATDHGNATVQWIKYVIAFWFVYRVVDTPERARDLMFAHVLGCALLGIYALMTGRAGDRLDGVGGPGLDDSNTLGMYFATAGIVGLGLFLTESGWRRWVTLACLALVMNGLVLTNTRGALLGLIAGGLFVALFRSKAHRRLFWVVAAFGCIGFVSILDKAFIERMWTISHAAAHADDEGADSSARSRMVIIEAQWRMFLDHPLGTGRKGTAALSPRYMEERWLTVDATGAAERSSHNTFMTTLVEQGVVGAVLYLWLNAWILVAVLRLNRLERTHGDARMTTWGAAIGGGLVVVFVSGNTADFLMAEVLFWLCAALVSLQQFASTLPRRDSAMPRDRSLKMA
jgi:hypothetical protein